MQYVRGFDAVNVCGSNVTLGIDQGRILLDSAALVVHGNDRDLDDPVVHARKEAGRLNVNDRELRIGWQHLAAPISRNSDFGRTIAPTAQLVNGKEGGPKMILVCFEAVATLLRRVGHAGGFAHSGMVRCRHPSATRQFERGWYSCF